MKELIQHLLGRAGYEIHRKATPAVHSRTMSGAIRWLASNSFRADTILDVGASDGRWSRECMRSYPEAVYVLYEPQPVHSASLDAFASEYPGQVMPVKKAVGPTAGELLFDVSDPWGGGPAKDGSADVLRVEQTTIDISIGDLGVSGPFLLKLDTHGYERSILAGSEETLKHCEILIIEAYNYRITDETLLFWELSSLLYERGFRPVDLVDVMRREFDRSLWQMDLVFVRREWPGFEYTSYK